MLKRVRIQGYKSLVDLEVTLQPLSVLLGSNASGKSNFLDALQLLSRMATHQTLEAAFDPPHRGYPLEAFTLGDAGIRTLLEKERLSFSIEADVQLSETVIENVNQQVRKIRETAQLPEKRGHPVREENLRYRIEIEMLPKAGILRVADEYLAALSADGKPKQNRKPFLERIGNRLHLRMEGQSHPLYYERYLDFSILSRSHYPPHYPHLTAMQQELSNWLTFYLEPREQMRLPNPVKAVDTIGSMGEDLAAFLNTLKARNTWQFESIQKSLQNLIPSITGLEVSVNDLGEVELEVREGDKRISARVLSEGTLRILGLFALMGAEKPPALIGLEEPENGVHPYRIQRIAQLLETRRILGDIQFIVTTHSSVLADCIHRESLYMCRKVDGNTEIERLTAMSPGPLWRKSDIEEALADEEALSPSERLLRGDFDA